MFVLDLFNTPYERALNEGAVDDLEARYIHGLNMKMLDLLDRAHGANPEMKAALKREFQKVKAERDEFFKINPRTGMTDDGMLGTTKGKLDDCMGYGGLVGEAGIGHDIVNKTEKMARATPQTKTGAVASTVKNAAKWLAGQGGPGKEGPTYEGAGDIEDRGEYDQEGDMAKDNLHTIRREAEELERILSDNDNLPEWVQDKLANVKGMITAVSEYMQTQHERGHEEMSGEEGVAMAEWKKEGPWKQIPKSKSGKPVDPRGEVTHLSDVARREAELKAQAQKKNSKEVDEAGGGWALDPKTRLELQKRKQRNKTIAKWAGRPVPPQDSKQKEINEDQRLSIGDPVIVTAPNEFEGKTGEIAELSPSGKFVVVNLYNHGQHSMHLSDIEYNQYADDQEEDDWYDDEVAEGWSDAIVAQRTGRPRTPYSVYIKGKKWKDFENDDHARAVMDKLKAKFAADGRDPSVITIAATDYDKDIKEAGSPAQQAAIAIAKKKEQGVTEGETDYSKRRQRERDVDAGKPVAKQRPSKMTDYQKKRAQDRKDMEMGEGDISQLEKAVADAPVKPIANMEESFESKIQLQGVTDQKLLEAARKIDTFSRSYK